MAHASDSFNKWQQHQGNLGYSAMLYLLDYGRGNVASLANSLTQIGLEYEWIRKPEDFAKASRVIFPGVGACGQAIESLKQKQLFEPLKDYILSGKPYMGICIGMQVLFEYSDEDSAIGGLGILKGHVGKFSEKGKSVPHIGWNSAKAYTNSESELSHSDKLSQDILRGRYFYFVHSFRVAEDEMVSKNPLWSFSTTQYGDESFVSSVSKGALFAVQFHPEKSGKSGLSLIQSWAQEKISSDVKVFDSDVPNGLSKRIVACLDVRTNDQGDLVVTKGDQYDVRESSSEVRNLGKPVELAKRYYDEGADEIVFLNITSFRSCPVADQPMLDVVRLAAKSIFAPLTIGGGIRDTVDPDGKKTSALDVATMYFRCGADKVSIGSDAVDAVEQLLSSPDSRERSSIETIHDAYGAQAVVVSIDPKRVYSSTYDSIPDIHKPGTVSLADDDLGPNQERFCWYACTVKGGRETRDLDALQLAQGVEKLGAGEILLNSVDRDGSGRGFDHKLINLIRNNVSIPVVASSGAGSTEHFRNLFGETQAEAALAAGIFHRREIPIETVKGDLKAKNLPVRIDGQ